ncbi:MAG: hypothetical protein AAFN30_10055, partial [Actinomycetota bacterium]
QLLDAEGVVDLEHVHVGGGQPGLLEGGVGGLHRQGGIDADAGSVEELLYTEALGFCGPGEAASLVADGTFDIGGRCAVSPSGGLLAMGHPIGPTGVGQVAEVTRQLRGEAGERQQPGARLGLAHMVGIGAVCVVHVLAGPNP